MVKISSLLQATPNTPTDFPITLTDENGFAYATPNTQLAFPRDHGSHPQFKNEWWYITGHLASPDGNHDYGFQVTFFRAATDDRQQLYMAHAAVLDKNSGTFLHEERLNSDSWNADAATGHLDLYNGNWYLRMENSTTEEMTSRFSLVDFGSLSLSLKPTKPKTLFGDQGYSRKGADTGAASHYITFTRLETTASLTTADGKTIPLSGIAWMDHEFSSSQLSAGQLGWNWTSLHFDDGSELMAYVMRREDGTVDPFSRLTLIAPNGDKTEIPSTDFSWTPSRIWTSPDSNANYPVEYTVSWKSGDTTNRVFIKPFADAQELSGHIGGFVYWEGACRAFDAEGAPIALGYTELTGYAESLFGKF